MTSTMARIIFFSFLLLLSIPDLTSAETRTFIKEYTYQASEEDSRNSSRVIALREVKRLLLEELGTYLESVTEVQHFQLTKDKITTLTAGIVKTEIIAEKWDGRTYWLQAKIAAVPDEVIKSINDLRKDGVKTKELEETRRMSDELLRENRRLHKELAMQNGQQRKIDQEAYNETIKKLTALEWFEKGYASTMLGDYRDAIDSLSHAIALNKNDGIAYYNRGLNFRNLSLYDAAIQDYNRAIAINPQNHDAYVNRGVAYAGKKQYDRAIEDYDRALFINPDDAVAYYNRGLSYIKRNKDYDRAIIEFNKAISLKSQYIDAYNNRAASYYLKKDYEKAINDYNLVLSINPKYAKAYWGRANVYHEIGNYRQMADDIKRACDLGLDEACEIDKIGR